MTANHCGQIASSVAKGSARMDELAMLETIQNQAFSYFPEYTDPQTGLIADCSRPQSPASIAAIGMGIASMAVAAERGWVSQWNYGLNQGPVVLMIENYRTELIWDLLKKSHYISTGLKRAGFTGGWLE